MDSATASLPLILKQLRLTTIANEYARLADKAIEQTWSHQRYLAELCHVELAKREDSRLQRLLKDAKLPPGKPLSRYDFSEIDGISEQRVEQLIQQHQWLKQGSNILVFGASGLGKTHLASSIGYGLVETGVKVKFLTATAVVQQLQQAKGKLALQEELRRLDRYAVLIIDDIGYVRKTEQETSVLFELIAHRYERHSLIITSNQDFKDWDQIFDDTSMTVAAIDRLVHNAHIIHCKGESYRRKSLQTETA